MNEVLLEVMSKEIKDIKVPGMDKLATLEEGSDKHINLYYPSIAETKQIIQDEINRLEETIFTSEIFSSEKLVEIKDSCEKAIIDRLKKISVNLNNFQIFIKPGESEGSIKIYAPLKIDADHFVD